MSIVNFTFLRPKSQSTLFSKRICKGFMLIELMLALGILALFWFPLAYWYSEGTYHLARAYTRSKLLQTARTFLERYPLMHSLQDSGTLTIDDITVLWKVTPVQALPHYRFINLTVSSKNEQLMVVTGVLL